jgi:uncharacterized RDD family membrane protein YckC
MESTSSPLLKLKPLPTQARFSRPAGFFSRFEAFVIDLVILSIIEVGGAAFIQAFLRFFRLTDLVANFRTWFQSSAFYTAFEIGIMTLVVIGYFAFFWSLVGFTPGKAILGLKVVRSNGGKVSFGRSLLRFFAYWVSALPLFLGFLWVLWDPHRQGWHDKIAGTQVFYLPKNLRK